MARARAGLASALKNAAAICDRPALATQAKTTLAGPSVLAILIGAADPRAVRAPEAPADAGSSSCTARRTEDRRLQRECSCRPAAAPARAHCRANTLRAPRGGQ